MIVKKSMIGLKPYEPGKPIEEVKEEYGLDEVIKLASNENPYGYSEKVKEVLQNSLNDLSIYPDGYARLLREKVAQFHQVKGSELIFGNGTDDIILHLSRVFLEKGDNIITATPTFSEYGHNATIEGAEVVQVPLLDDGSHDLQRILETIDIRTKIVYICNPNNPTGTYTKGKAFIEFLENIPIDILVVSDEAYYDYVVADDYLQTIPLINNFQNLIVLRTFSKAYGLAALRIGYGVANESLIRAIEPARPPFNTNTLGQRAAYEAIDDQTFIQDCVKKNRDEMKRIEDFCEEMGLDYRPSQANFILIDCKEESGEIFQKLLEKGIIVRNGEAFGFSTSIRVTVGKKEENDRLMEELRKLL